jgi:hypothetical protein
MKKIFGTLALGLGLVTFGTNDAQAASPFCFDFSAFCDCLTVNIASDNTGGQPTRRYVTQWENQDCAGTTSNLQGGNHDNSYNAGELNSIFGLAGYNFNFTWRSNGVFDLDLTTDGTTSVKIQDNSPYVIVAGACPSDCSAAAKAQGLPSSSGR